jgi:hypothetical protein
MPREKHQLFKPPASLRYVCRPNVSEHCAIQLSIHLREQEREKKFKEKKKAYKEQKLSTRKRAAKEACHAYIRERDKNDPCICCGLPLGDDFHAGHFLESGNYSSIRYDEDNIHGQRLQCNHHKGGDSGEYEVRLRKKIGARRVNRLHKIKSEIKRWTVEELRQIENDFKAKLEALLNA